MFLLLYVEDDTLVWSGDYDSITSATENIFLIILPIMTKSLGYSIALL